MTIEQVVCPVDFSPASANALHHAAAWADWYGVPLRVLHVAMPPQVLADGVGQILVFPARPLVDVQVILEEAARRAAADNPTARIMTWDRARPGVLELTTTTPHLAQRLGHALEKAFSGVVHYDFSDENQVARVTWRRD